MKYALPQFVTLKDSLPEKYTQETKFTFIDERYGEFITNFRAFIRSEGLSTHPKAKQQRAAKTNMDKYGVAAPAQNKAIQDKMKATTKERYDVENASQSEEIKQKKKNTLLSNYNVTNPMFSNEIKEKLKNTNLSKYGVENVMFNEDIQNKHRQTQINSGYAKTLPNGKTIPQYYKELDKPYKANAQTVYHQLGADVAEKWIKDYIPGGPSSLETFAQLNIPILESYGKGVGKYRPDFIARGKREVFIDVDGFLYHSDEYKPEYFHSDKREYYESVGIPLLQFQQDEIVYKYEIVESIIKSKIGLIEDRIFARNCILTEISHKIAKSFIEQHHLMGASATGKAIGLFFNGELVSVLTYKKYKTGIDIVRFCTKKNTIVVGSLSKCVKWLERNVPADFIQSFVDMRYGNGNSLKVIGFKLVSCKPGFKWTNGKETFHRSQCAATDTMTEKEHAFSKGWKKLHDAGQAKYVKVLK